MSTYELAKTYNPSDHEPNIYENWEKSGAFKPDGNTSIQQPNKQPFSIILPPPNANGNLHTGHAMFVVEDIMTRYRRMQGHPTLWLPGMDHAGIETQVVYERELSKQGKDRFDLGREEFYNQVDAFTKANMGNMVTQLKSLGFSLDWSRLTYTLDQNIIKTVYETFKNLHNQGLIYRGNRIVNWCPHCRSAFSDIEVKYREQLDPLYYIKYGPFVLATVRPETKFGDTAIAVNPKDERYQKYIGQTITADDLNGPIQLTVIADSFVDPEFGTGAVKVTPAHDPNDWEMGVRHNLEVKQVIGTDGLLTEIAGKYAGMQVAEARIQVATELETKGLMDHVDMNYTHSVGYHDRCGTLIEPLVIEQWWLKVEELKRPAIKAIKAGNVKFVPERFTKVALDWLENMHDWNIGRQNWWGIRIPVFYNATNNTSLPEYIIGTESEAKDLYGENGYEIETDNFDTWFSSGQWPYATLKNTGDFERFYPTSVMETGRDILFPWVSRMIMFGLYRTGEVPFGTVYLHGLVNDANGKKMSKSKGNVINPLELTAKYGTDALRLALTIGITPGNDGALGESKVEGYRNFCNKLWNVARFILGQLPEDYSPTPPVAVTLADKWILSRINQSVDQITDSIEKYRFSEAGELIYSLTWNDFADWYIESSKTDLNPDMLVHVLSTILKLAHPIAPYITETIWKELPGDTSQLIITAWPEAGAVNNADIASFLAVQQVIMAARSLISEEQIVKPVLLTTDKNLIGNQDLIKRLARISELRYVEWGTGLYLSTSTPVWIEASDELVLTRKNRLRASISEKQVYLKSLDTKLANERYISSAPVKIVEETKLRRSDTADILSKLEAQLKSLD